MRVSYDLYPSYLWRAGLHRSWSLHCPCLVLQNSTVLMVLVMWWSNITAINQVGLTVIVIINIYNSKKNRKGYQSQRLKPISYMSIEAHWTNRDLHLSACSWWCVYWLHCSGCQHEQQHDTQTVTNEVARGLILARDFIEMVLQRLFREAFIVESNTT